jgi:sulfatase-like protein
VLAGPPPRLRSSLAEAGHIAALWAFAVAQPLFELLGSNPEFFATRGSPSRDIVVFAVVVALVPPLALFGVELLLGLMSGALGRAFHLTVVALLAAAIVLQLTGLSSPLPAFLLASAAGIAASLAYLRLRSTRSLLSVLSPAPVVFLVIFLTLSDVSPLVLSSAADVKAANVAARAPVVVIVFDELPLTSLLDRRGRIDARSYPNFARLTRGASWYRNTATVHADTPYAVPAIIDGRLPEKYKLPVAADHPRSIFSLFGGRYSLHVREEATAICPPRLCRERALPDFARRMRGLWEDLSRVYLHELLPENLERKLPSVERTWAEFEGKTDPAEAQRAAARVQRIGARRRETKRQRKRRLTGNLNGARRERFERFVSAIRGGGRPRLQFIHALLPHVPFQYLPSGRAYRTRPNEDIEGLNSSVGFHVEWLVEQGYQRHLLQLGEADRMLGRLLGRLRRLGLYDRSLIAVVADHGASFQLGHDRRWVRPGNIQDIAPVPFLLKAPGQRRGRVSDKPLRTVDVLPTIADVLDVPIPWHVDGRSALKPTVAAQRHRRVIGKHGAYSVPVDVPGFAAARRVALRHKWQLFGNGLYAIGPDRALVGRPMSELAVTPQSGPRAEFIDPGRYRRVEPDSGYIPVHVVGRLRGGVRGGGKAVAVAVNGRIAATGYTFSLADSDDEDFAVFLPESALRRGRNRLELLWLQGANRIQYLGSSG